MPDDRRVTRAAADATTASRCVTSFVRSLSFADLPPEVVWQAKRCLLDLIGVGAAGSRTTASALHSAGDRVDSLAKE